MAAFIATPGFCATDEEKCAAKGWVFSHAEVKEDGRRVVHCTKPAALAERERLEKKQEEVRAVRAKIAEVARRYRGSEAWAYRACNSLVGANRYKCSQFVADVAREAGALVPNIRVRGKYPPLAGDWGDPKVTSPGWIVVSDPQPGDVVAEPHRYSNATGHCGIVTGDRLTTSANALKRGAVDENDFGFRPQNHPVFRRYVGGAE
ncbi:MAG: hypothetical protein HY553_22425 [Elusimicrobia bacterium]|nr:hypothetical protein [Elusimicrobiota bacterium]